MTGPGFRWLNPAGHHYGVPRLVDALLTAAAEVDRQRPGGAPLMIGDLSKRLGGQIAGHRSHRTGRDVDLLFFAETPGGEPVTSPGFVKFGPDGLAVFPSDRGGTRFIRLDVAREWLLVKALMLSPLANVQWLFISAPLEALLTEYARARGEDPELIWHAETVMLQPGDSLPHDDHLHLRTACTPEEAMSVAKGAAPIGLGSRRSPPSPPPNPTTLCSWRCFRPSRSNLTKSKTATPFVRLPSTDEGARGLAPRDAPSKARPAQRTD